MSINTQMPSFVRSKIHLTEKNKKTLFKLGKTLTAYLLPYDTTFWAILLIFTYIWATYLYLFITLTLRCNID